MKNIILNIIAIVVPAVFFIINTAGAGDRVKVFEMGEGGFTIEFPMTSDEIAAADTAYHRVIDASKKSVGNLSNRVKVFEMGEGGYTVEFRMTAAEITAVNAENARLAAVKSATPVAPPENEARYELAESGHVIDFPAASNVVEMGGLALTRDNPAQTPRIFKQ
jgi:hypothetical protein